MASQDHPNDARRQIALALMEAHTGETLPPTGEQLMEAADVFLSLHDYQLAQMYLQRAQAAGAPEMSNVRIGLANTYLALGDTTRAQGELSAIGGSADSEPGYQYLLASANVFRQQHQNAEALTAFAQAASAAVREDQTAYRDLLQAGGDEGLRLDRRVSFLSSFSVEPIFEDMMVYPLDANLTSRTRFRGGRSAAAAAILA